MNLIKFEIPGEAVAQGRARAGRTKTGKTVVYDPANSRNYKSYIRLVAGQNKPKQLIEGPVDVTIRVYKKIPKSMPKYMLKMIEEGTLRPTTKPDVDNYAKSIKDGLNGIIWKDDSQVVSLTIEKYYLHTPRVEVEVIEYESIPKND